MTGRLTTNTEPHQKCWSSTPATIGPSGRPTIVEMPSTAMARVRSAESKSTTTEDIANGMRTAAPRPSSVRAAMRLPAFDASAHQSDPAKNTTRPTIVERFRP